MALCVTEPLVLGVNFDAGALTQTGLPGTVLANASVGLRFLLAGAAAFGAGLALHQGERTAWLARLGRNAQWRPVPLLVHALSFGVLYVLSRRLFGGNGANASGVAVAAWFAAAALTGATLVASALPVGQWRDALGETRRTATAALLAGAAALALAPLAERLWPMLSQATLRIVLVVLDRLEPEVLVNEAASAIGTPSFVVEIAPECSGMEGMGLAIVFLGVVLAGRWSELRVGRVLAFAPVLLGCVWLLNGLRIAALVWLGTHVSPELAFGAFHSKAGWVLFCAVGVGTVALLRTSPWFAREEKLVIAASGDPYNPVVVYCLPLGLQLLCGMATGSFTQSVDWLYGVRALGIGLGLYAVRRFLPNLAPSAAAWPAAIGVVGFVIWMVFEGAPDPTQLALARQHFEAVGSLTATTWIVLRIVGSVALVPIAEELAFRGFLLRRLTSRDADDFERVSATEWTPVSVLVSSLVFGALHANWVGGALCGALYAFAQQRRGRLGDAMVAHATTNLLVAIAVLAFGQWHLWL